MNKNTPSIVKRRTNSCILISFCNQLSSPNHSLSILDPTNGNSQWIDLSGISELRQGFSGITGSCRAGEEIIIATQSATPALACVNMDATKVTNHITLEKSKDIHSLVFHKGYIYLVSTGTNEIYRVPFQNGQFGSEELFWGHPGVSYNKDEVHLNGLTIDEECLVASCFGSKRADGSWGTEGRIFYVLSGHTIHGNLNQPHSPTVDGRRLVFAESAAHKIHLYNKDEHDNWIVDNEVCLGGYARGIALKNDRLYVAVSADRKLSRSQQKVMDVGVSENRDSAFVEIDLATGSQVANLSLLGFGREVYDLIAIHTYSTLFPAHYAMSARVRAIESTVDRYIADLSRVYLENIEINNRLQASQNELERRLEVSQNELERRLEVERRLKFTQNETYILQQTVSWRITAPLRTFRRLWSRLACLKDKIKES